MEKLIQSAKTRPGAKCGSDHELLIAKIRLTIFFAAKDEQALYSQQKQDWELTVAQIMSSLPNSDLN